MHITVDKVCIMSRIAKEEDIAVNRKFPGSITRMLLSLDVVELKERLVTENGLSIAEEERILRQQESLDITATLETEEDVENHFKSLRKE